MAFIIISLNFYIEKHVICEKGYFASSFQTRWFLFPFHFLMTLTWTFSSLSKIIDWSGHLVCLTRCYFVVFYLMHFTRLWKFIVLLNCLEFLLCQLIFLPREGTRKKLLFIGTGRKIFFSHYVLSISFLFLSMTHQLFYIGWISTYTPTSKPGLKSLRDFSVSWVKCFYWIYRTPLLIQKHWSQISLIKVWISPLWNPSSKSLCLIIVNSFICSPSNMAGTALESCYKVSQCWS
jgi:hypothetical protein